MHKIFVCSQSNYLTPFKHLFKEVYHIRHADVVMFTGGSDVSPRLYGETCGKNTQCNWARDQLEVQWANYAIDKGLPMLGICRGAQFLTVVAGGKLIQDVTDHCQTHEIYTTEGYERRANHPLLMSSTHHQMMHPYTLDKNLYKVIAFAQHRSKHYFNGGNQPIPHSGIEPEIVCYPRIKALCIQGHPESMDVESEGVGFCQRLVKEYLCV